MGISGNLKIFTKSLPRRLFQRPFWNFDLPVPPGPGASSAGGRGQGEESVSWRGQGDSDRFLGLCWLNSGYK